MLDNLESYEWGIRSISVDQVFNFINSKRLILRPEYQRRSVWPDSSKSSFIESIILNVPIPLFLINKISDDIWEVVDGQQRLSSIYTFMKDNFEFSKLVKLNEFNGYKYSDLPAPIQTKIKSHNLLFAIVENASEEQIIDMYYRSNKFTVNLNPQELRYAYYKNSDLKDLVISISEGENGHDGLVGFFLQTTILRESNVARMADLEYTSELLSLLIYNSLQDKKKVLDNIYDDYSTLDEDKRLDLTENIYRVIEDIKHIFSAEIFKNEHSIKAEKALSLTRFKQKNDFYSLFFVIAQLQQNNMDALQFLLNEKLNHLAAFLKIMDEYVSPEADIEIFSKYAIKCVSQANTRKSREYRSKFLLEGIEYILGGVSLKINLDHENINLIENFEKQTNQLFSEFGFTANLDMRTMSFIDAYRLLAEFYYDAA
ncbi:MAG: DUF262 domain-containing protein [Bacteroidales bacterium]|nr:DUF262 domain-containing protein [Bacteroidales bacterium]